MKPPGQPPDEGRPRPPGVSVESELLGLRRPWPDPAPSSEPGRPPAAGEALDAGMAMAASTDPAAVRRVGAGPEALTDRSIATLGLPPATQGQLEELRVRLLRRSQVAHDLSLGRRLDVSGGFLAVFVGGPDTGVRLVAERLAQDLGVLLRPLDLTATVHRHQEAVGAAVGELLAQAKADRPEALVFLYRAGVLLDPPLAGSPFDARAAALAEVWDRLAAHDGAVILAASQRRALQERTQDLVHAVLEFPALDPAVRVQILRAMFPEHPAPPSEEDLQELATRFRLSDASWRNVVLDAVTWSLEDAGVPLQAGKASATGAVLPCHLAKAVAREYRKLGRLVSRGEFGERLFRWVEQADCREPSP